MPDLPSQLRDYVESTIERVDLDDVAAAVSVGQVGDSKPGRRRPVWVALGVAALLMLLVGVPALLWRGGNSPVVDQPTTTAATPPPDEQDRSAPFNGLSLSWTRVPLGGPDSEAEAVAAFDGGFVVVGQTPDGAAVWTSPDGITWTQAPHDDSFGPALDEGTVGMSGGMLDVIAGGPGLIAVGTNATDPANEPAVWTSTDGNSWSVTRPDRPADTDGGILIAVAEGGPGFVAVGDAEQVFTSVDGLTWIGGGQDFSLGNFADVTTGASGLVAVGGGSQLSDACVWTSSDGFTWTAVPYERAICAWEWVSMNAVTTGGPGFVAVGGGPLADVDYDDAAWEGWAAWVWTSPDGRTWTRVPHDEEVFGGASFSASMNDVVSIGDALVAVGGVHYGGDSDEHAAAWTSTAGTVWKRVPHGNAVFGYAAINDIAVFDDGLIAVGDGSVWIASPES